MKEPKINKETAAKEVADFLEVMDIDTERSNKEAQAHMDNLIEALVAAVMKGRLSFNESSEPVVTPWRTADVKQLTVKEPTGANLMAPAIGDSDLKAMLKVLAELTNVSHNVLAKLKSAELNLLQVIYTFFTAA